MNDSNPDQKISLRKNRRIPKEGAGYAVLRIVGGFLQWFGVFVWAAAILGSCYGSIRGIQSFLPFQEQKMAGFVTIITFSYILVFFTCLFLLGGSMVAGGMIMKSAGTRKAQKAADSNDTARDHPPMTDGQNGRAADGR